MFLFVCLFMLTDQSTSNTSSFYILLPMRDVLKYFYFSCTCFRFYFFVAQGCREYNTIIEAVQQMYKSLEGYSISIAGVWFNRSYIGNWKDPVCEVIWNHSKFCIQAKGTKSKKPGCRRLFMVTNSDHVNNDDGESIL